MITKKFGVDFESFCGVRGALTLPTEYVLPEGNKVEWGKVQARTHANGWTVSGEIREDYYEWVNKFGAVHPKLGRVWGDFEDEVFADSEEAFEDFYKNFPPDDWDYDDI